MSALSPRATRAAGLAAGFAGLLLGLLTATGPNRAAHARDGQPKDEKKDFPKPPADHKLVGAAVCQDCHDREDPSKNPLYKQTLGYEFVRLWENKVWGVHDLHSTAFKNLLSKDAELVKKGKAQANPTAQLMENNLKRYKGADYLVSTDTACLACHASVKLPITEQAPPAKWTPASFSVLDGVGCEMCHGHGSGYQQKHQESREDEANAPEGAVRVVDWREWPPAEKRKWGLVNLRDPAEATTQCASCHIGNVKEGRFVTHDMYAAGHPPLPPLDLIAYTREQPRHWGLPTEMPYLTKLVKKNPKRAEDVFHIRAGESHVARRFVESTIATLRASAEIGGQLAGEAKDDGLDYAAFDCASCHHNLKYPSDRQDRGYLGKPGRPLYRPATFALSKVVLAHAAVMEGGADLKASLDALFVAEKQLADAFTDKSLGDPVKVKAATTKVIAWADDTLKKLGAVRYTPKATQDLLAKLTEAAAQAPKDADPKKRAVADPEVAQLFSWAAETLLLDQIPSKEKGNDGQPLPPPEVVALRKSLDKIVVTRLRPKAPFHYEVPGGVPGPTLEAVDTRIGERMGIFNSFQSAPFRKAFGEVKPFGK
ncbi:MAG: hypothetical protein FJ304_06300 [Planctomycetes bacterium]|nr:hypothetical protein [Planctomycetota bacterium]